jgi:hypothetical protein
LKITNAYSSKENEIKLIDSYDVENNIFNTDYLKKLILLQRQIKEFLRRRKTNKTITIVLTKKSNRSLNFSKFSDVQSLMSKHSNMISKRSLIRFAWLIRS